MRRKAKTLSGNHFAGDVLELTPQMLGNDLCLRAEGEVIRLPITEVEAYNGMEDQACHAHLGRTPRSEVLFGPPGHWYVYLCYGVHWLLNIVTGPVNYPAAILIRGAGDHIGPGRLTKALGIDQRFNRQPLGRPTGLWVEETAVTVPPSEVQITPRIGMSERTGEWGQRPWRWVWKRK